MLSMEAHKKELGNFCPFVKTVERHEGILTDLQSHSINGFPSYEYHTVFWPDKVEKLFISALFGPVFSVDWHHFVILDMGHAMA